LKISPYFEPLAVTTVISLNILFYWLVVRRAIRKFIKPELKKRNLVYLKYKLIPPFGTGDFVRKQTLTLFVIGNGNVNPEIYVYIYYKSSEMEKRITARIYSKFLFISKIEFSALLD